MMDVRVLEMLNVYPQYIESLAGKRPTTDQVVEKALSSDVGFQKYLTIGHGKAIPKPKETPGNETSEAAGNRQKTAAQAG